MTKDEAATEVYRRLAADVTAIAPKGIGFRSETWSSVDPSTVDFCLALSKWEQTASEADRLAVKKCYENVMAAWRRAVVAYERTIQRSDKCHNPRT